ncbi:hypothetical protein O181_018338 [Austropuccinia psidii MF-1]|uniref:Uncharacterized protein n=1 Tax=Austropuccinia psidii MF-1 TaxID=1389203 RepID=A0A9Q3C7R6_9BASI|nr:hypothetical protein [Austropuccinia psidii MF-1]
MTNACDACQQAHKKCLFVVQPFRPRRPCKDSFVVDNDESIPEQECTPGPQTSRWKRFWTISPVPSSIDLSTPPPRPPSNGHFTPRLEQSDYPADEGWQWQEDIQAWANRHHVLSPMGFKCQICLVSKLWQPTPGPSGTQWLEDLFRSKQAEFHLISTFNSSELTVPPFVEPSQKDEPPIPGLSPSSKPHEDVPTCEPEPEVALTQSIEEPFGKSQFFLTFPLANSTPLHYHHQRYAHWIPPSLPVPQRTPLPPPLIPRMMLARNLLTYHRP